MIRFIDYLYEANDCLYLVFPKMTISNNLWFLGVLGLIGGVEN